jgi:pimeloyl-ACP methyl ester carboxylesterase
MDTVKSKDGTVIAYDRSGKGPALILVAGAIATRADAVPLVASLSLNFTVYAYDRRGKGDSGDTPPYAVDREIEDLGAVIGEAGGTAYVFGHSSGAVLALKAARVMASQITKLAVYEPPILVDDHRPPQPADFVSRLTELVSSGHRDEAVEYFLVKGLDMPASHIAGMRQQPFWEGNIKAAHTLPYEGEIVADLMTGKLLVKDQWAAVTLPTLVMDGGRSFPFMHSGAKALIAVLPNARRRYFPDQDHGPSDAVLAPALVEFFKS